MLHRAAKKAGATWCSKKLPLASPARPVRIARSTRIMRKPTRSGTSQSKRKRDGSIEETAQHRVGRGSEFGDVEHQNLVGASRQALVGASRRTAGLRPELRVSDA